MTIEELFRDAGATGSVHARRVTDADDEVAHQADDPMPMASTYKLPLAMTWGRLVDRGELDPVERLVLTPDRRTAGPTGVSIMLDDVALSARDAIRLMLSVSDNATADHLLGLVGADRVNERMTELGLSHTIIRRTTRDSLARVRRDTHTRGFGTAMQALADLDHDVVTREYSGALASATTARDMTTLLSRLWTDSPAGPGTRLVRGALGQQAMRHRIGSGFPHDDVLVAGKTGSMGRLRHEVAVITFPGEIPVAVAVFTLAARAERHLPAVDRAIGAIARAAVTPLRRALS